MFTIVFVILSISALSNANLVKANSRTLLLSKDSSIPPGYPAPTASQLIGLVFDANHSQMISSNLYTSAEVATFVANAKKFILDKFGVNFSAGQVSSNGTIGLPTLAAPQWLSFPYAAQNVIDVIFDSDNLARGVNLNYKGSQFGVIVVCTSDTIFPGGDHAGDFCSSTDVLAYFNYDLLRTDVPPSLTNFFRETILFQSEWTSKNIINSEGNTDSLSKLAVIDSRNKTGFAVENIVFNGKVATGISSKTRVFATWDN